MVNPIIIILVVLVLLIPTIFRPWLYYDEGIIFQGTYFPNINSIKELFEIIKEFGLNHTFISSNAIYSSNHVLRSCPLDISLGTLVNYFLKSNPVFYHIFNLVLHLLNTLLIYLVLKRTLLNKFLIIVLSLIWACHPTTLETVLLSTNWGATLCYIFFFALLLDFLKNKERNISTGRRILIPLLFFIPLLKNEQIISLPFVLFIISFYFSYQQYKPIKAFKTAVLECLPYFIGLVLYLTYFFFFSSTHELIPSASDWLPVTLERIFWLSPQIFFHFIKLVFYPGHLSIDQSFFVTLGKSLFDPYSIFCFVFLASWLLVPLILFLAKKRFSNLFLLNWTFFAALLPFLHILTPSYSLANERYLYAPLALLIFGLSKMLSNRATVKVAPTALLIFGLSKLLSNRTTVKVASTVLFVILILCFVRSYYRTLDWKDNSSFINSSYKNSSNSLHKAIKLGMLGKTISIFEPAEKQKARSYFLKALKFLEKAKEELQENKKKYQNRLPLVIKTYGLDYDSLLAKIAYLEASTRYIELNEDYKVGLEILQPHMKNLGKADPLSTDLYVDLLLVDKKYQEAKNILLKVNSMSPHLYPILIRLFNYSMQYENNKTTAEKYLKELLKLYPYDINALEKALGFYYKYKDPLTTARLAYKYGLRTHSNQGYRAALSIYLNLDKLHRAKKIITKLLQYNSQDPEDLYLISRYYYKIKDYTKSLKYLQHAHSISKQINPNSKLTQDIESSLTKLLFVLGEKEKK